MGSVRVCKLTLLRFFRLHFILPFIILVFVILHIIFLHDQGSSNPGGTKSTKKAFNQFQRIVDFLFAYAILRSITNKLGGVVGLVSSIFILYFLALKAFSNFNSFSHKPLSKIAY